MLDKKLLEQLKLYMENIKNPIKLISFADDNQSSKDMLDLLDQIASTSDKITHDMSESNLDMRVPSFKITQKDSSDAIVFAGIPLGHEFTSLVLALLHISGHPPKIDDKTVSRIKSIKDKLDIETYFSLSCQNCPDVIQAINIIAALNPNVTHTSIDGALFQDEVEKRQVMAVPSVYLNGELLTSGRQSMEDILDKLSPASKDEDINLLNSKPTFDVLVVGAGPAGASASIYAARKGISTGMITDRFGGQVLDTMSIENFISVPFTQGPKLSSSLEEHVRQYGVDIIKSQKVEKIDKLDNGFKLTLSNGANLSSKSIILSPGARWRALGIKGEDEYKNKGVTFCPHCDGPLFKGKKVAVIGGGNSGVEAAIDLAGIVDFVYVVEFDDKLRADKVLQDKLNSLGNTKVILNAQAREIKGDNQRVTALDYIDRVTQGEKSIDIQGVFIQIGLLPNTEWLDGFVDLNSRGEIIIDDKGQTSVSGVLAAGDATTTPYKQIVISVGAGATASLSAFDYLIRN